MSELRDILANSITDRMTYTGETVKNLRTGKTFKAEYEEISDIEMNEALGRDPRESATLHVQDRIAAATLFANDKIEIRMNGVTAKFVVLGGRRKDNPGSSQVEFGLMKFVQGRDT